MKDRLELAFQRGSSIPRCDLVISVTSRQVDYVLSQKHPAADGVG